MAVFDTNVVNRESVIKIQVSCRLRLVIVFPNKGMRVELRKFGVTLIVICKFLIFNVG